MEVRVFRARGRKRVVPEVGRWEGLERGGREIRCVFIPQSRPRFIRERRSEKWE